LVIKVSTDRLMKTFNGKKLLDEDESPSHQALTETRHMQYALDKLTVLTVLSGIRNDDVPHILHYLEVFDVERDYSILGIVSKLENYHQCVYYKHYHL